MSNMIIHPKLSDLLPLDKIPSELESIREALESIFDDIFVKNLIASQSYDGSSGRYTMSLTTYDTLGLNIPMVDGLKLVLNPNNQGQTEIPVSFDYSWIILRYINDFDLDSFDNTVRSVYYILLDLAGIDEQTLFMQMLNNLFPSATSLIDFVQNFNQNYTQVLEISNDNTLSDLEKSELIYEDLTNFDLDIVEVIFERTVEIDNQGLERLKSLFSQYFSNIEASIKKAITLNFNASIDNISVGLQFPHKWLRPVYTGNENVSGSINLDDPLPDNFFSFLTFDVGSLSYNSSTGFVFNNVNAFNLNRSMIGKTGLIAEFQGLKIDLKSDSNIPEANADGRDLTFKGVYAEFVDIILPKKWFKSQENVNQTLKLFGRRLLIGSGGGISGTIGLEAIVIGNPISEADYLEYTIGDNGFKIGFNKFDITFKQNKVVSSNIRAMLEIPKLVYPQGHAQHGSPRPIEVTGHLDSEGDFNLTASVEGGVKASLGNYVDFNFLSAELGKQGDDFYIGTQVELTFPNGFMHEMLGDQKIVIPRLRFYSNGRFEIVGGTGMLPVNISLPLGPVNVSVTAINIGSIQKSYQGQMRNYNFVGFDGGIKVDPFGIDARGEGIKYYYTTDDDPSNGKPGHSFVHIQTIEIDLVIPASTKMVSIYGMLSIPEPGKSPEYMGEIAFKLNKPNISGAAAMRLAPKHPAFIVDASVDLPAPITMGTFAIYGFRGLIGYRYVAEKRAIQTLPATATWYDYYKHPRIGINIRKFSGPYDNSTYNNPFSFGAGIVLGTGFDNGNILAVRAFLLLSIPSLIMIEGRASILKTRPGLEDERDPMFWAMIAYGDNTLEFGFGANYKLRDDGEILELNANLEALFPIKNMSNWYLNIGTRQNPNRARIFKTTIDLNAWTYLMISSSGIEAGARIDFNINRSFFGIRIKLWAFLEVGGKVSFERPQIGGYIHLGGGIEVNVWRIIFVHFSLDAYLSAEAVKPFLIFAQLQFVGRIKVLFIRIRFRIKLTIKWEKNNQMDYRPLPPLANGQNTTPVHGNQLEDRLNELVKGVHMLTSETFDFKYFSQVPNPSQIDKIIPLDTYVDIKFTKSVDPSNVSGKIGGHTTGADNFIELLPPEKVVRGGRVLRQVKHKYRIEDIEIKAHNGSNWVNYHPAVAATNDNNHQNIKLGFWQRTSNRYDTIRLLSNNSFSHINNGEPGWFIPEQYGITASNLFCSEQIDTWHTSNVLNMPLNQSFALTGQTNGHLINGAYYLPIGEFGAEIDTILPIAYNTITVTDWQNPHQFIKSLAFGNVNGMQILLPQDASIIKLKLTAENDVKIRFYEGVTVDGASSIQMNLVDELNLTPQDLLNEITYDFQNNQSKPIIKIEVIPNTPLYEDIEATQNAIEALLIAVYGNTMNFNQQQAQQYEELMSKLESLVSGSCIQALPTNNNNALHPYCELLNNLSNLYCSEIHENLNWDLFYQCFGNVATIIRIFSFTSYPSYYPGISNHVDYLLSITSPHQINTYEAYIQYMLRLQAFLSDLEKLGNCYDDSNNCATLFHQIKWKTVVDYEYEQTIPEVGVVNAQTEEMVNGINEVIHPIWRPNTAYYVHFRLSDTVDQTKTDFNYYYGFKTAGPIGHFHDASGVTYGNEYNRLTNQLLNRKNNNDQINALGKLTNPDKYKLTKLESYIDNHKSFPNMDSHLVHAKPMFYGNGAAKIYLFFNKPYLPLMFSNWGALQGSNNTILGNYQILIMDPVQNEIIPYPLPINNETIPNAIPENPDGGWQPEIQPFIPLGLQLIQNMVNNGELPCTFELGNPIFPLSFSLMTIAVNLKPEKLYTAQINNLFDNNNDNQFEDYLNPARQVYENEIKTIHQFLFRTSKYVNFESQINSYKIFENEQEVGKRVYKWSFDFSNNQLSNAYQLVSKNNINLLKSEGQQDLFDRVIESVFLWKPLHPALDTEFIWIKNKLTNKTVALLIRNPEPFNIPKLTDNELDDTLIIKDIQDNVLTNCKKLFSKDRANILVMNQNLEIAEDLLIIDFKYKMWNGNAYQIEASVNNVTINQL